MRISDWSSDVCSSDLAAAIARLERHGPQSGLTGINIGANKDAADRIADYASGVRNMAPLADYLTINISSPNTHGLRALQDKGALDALLAAVMVERGSAGPPIFLKVAPDQIGRATRRETLSQYV